MKNNKEETFIQVWDYLLENPELDNTDVILLAKIISLGSTKDGCYMTNSYICKLIKLKDDATASRRVTKLENLGYIECRRAPSKNNSKKTKRFIHPTYEKGLILKSMRFDSKVKPALIQKSMCIDSKVKPSLIQESSNKINDNNNLLNQTSISTSILEPNEGIAKIIYENTRK